MLNDISSMNLKGKYCYGIKIISGLIEHFGYDYDNWRDFLICLTDFTLIDMYSGTEGRRSKHWSPSEYSPAEILEPVYMPDSQGRDFYPCDNCPQKRLLFEEYGAESGFCLNFKNCGYVSAHYRYTRPDKNKYSQGQYKKLYDLFMTADISLLRVIYDTLALTDETAGELFDGDRMPIINDMLTVYKALGIGIPDMSGIPDEGFGKPCSFDSIRLIKNG